MKRCSIKSDKEWADRAVSDLISYIIISTILMLLMAISFLTINTVFLEQPSDRLSYYSFTDIANGISTRFVDISVIAPENGTIESKFDIPDDVAGKNYFVEFPRLKVNDINQSVSVHRGSIFSNVSIAGIGISMPSGGTTTGAGINVINYNSYGYNISDVYGSG